MGSGRSGIYYTTHGSRMIHHKALIHSLEGDYTTPSKKGVPIRLKSGGHGQAAISNSKGSKKKIYLPDSAIQNTTDFTEKK